MSILKNPIKPTKKPLLGGFFRWVFGFYWAGFLSSFLLPTLPFYDFIIKFRCSASHFFHMYSRRGGIGALSLKMT
jgi:hypothetical protein